jgi:hypothetical protein
VVLEVKNEEMVRFLNVSSCSCDRRFYERKGIIRGIAEVGRS